MARTQGHFVAGHSEIFSAGSGIAAFKSLAKRRQTLLRLVLEHIETLAEQALLLCRHGAEFLKQLGDFAFLAQQFDPEVLYLLLCLCRQFPDPGRQFVNNSFVHLKRIRLQR